MSQDNGKGNVHGENENTMSAGSYSFPLSTFHSPFSNPSSVPSVPLW